MLAWLVVVVVGDFGKVATVDVGAVVDGRILFAAVLYEAQQHLRKTFATGFGLRVEFKEVHAVEIHFVERALHCDLLVGLLPVRVGLPYEILGNVRA